jgi:hypothetical protein
MLALISPLRRVWFGRQPAKQDMPLCEHSKQLETKGCAQTTLGPMGCRRKARLRRCDAWQWMTIACAPRLAFIAFLWQRSGEISVSMP